MSLNHYDRTHMCQHDGLLGPVCVDGCRVCYRCGASVEQFTEPTRFASRPVDLHGQVAQSVEHSVEARSVVGSTPTLTTSAQVAQSVERRPEKASVGGSIPSLGTTRKRRFTI